MGPVESIDPMAINAPDRADFLGGATWHVLDSTGEFMGAIEMPRRFRSFRMTDDAISAPHAMMTASSESCG
jgi:hypothetical protein